MRSRKTVFIILAIVVFICVAFLVIGALIVPKSQRASTYGIADKESSALVIYNKTSEFYILSIDVNGKTSEKIPGLIRPGNLKFTPCFLAIYKVFIHYSDRAKFSDSAYIEWYVDGLSQADFSIKKGRAVIFALMGGDVRGLFYDPPELENNTGEINPDQD